jgi:CRISPR-associated endonuclease/helicase Cas3
MERYFNYAFFQRSKEMAYPVEAPDAGRNDTLLDMLSCNPHNPGNMPFQPSLRQSFDAAGELFRVIDAPTRGLIVPYHEGKQLIADLCGIFDPKQQGPLLRRAQRYSVNVFPHTIKSLQEIGAVHETQAGSGVLYLDGRYYSENFGLSLTAVDPFEPLIC